MDRTHPPPAAHAPAAAHAPPPPPRARPSRIHALQVRAFLEASEVVDADPDTLEDILDGFDEGTLDVEDEHEELDVDVQGTHDETNGVGAVDEYIALLEEAESAWPPEAVKQMKRDLKEHGMAFFLNEYVINRAIPIPKLLYAFGVCLCPELRMKRRKTLLYFLEVAMYQVLQKREKLPMYNTVDDAVELIKKSRNIMILTGAGISVSCGIPDFRSRNGLYAQLQERGEYDLDDPQQMFDIHYFREKPAVFYSFASQIYPSNFIPSPCHRFIKLIEDKGKLLRNYTQNIDTLETRAGVQKVLQCHGSFATASCINCKVTVPGNAIEADIMNHNIPLCKLCAAAPVPASAPAVKPKKKGRKKLQPWESDGEEEPDVPELPPGIMKPDITFFGEKLTDAFEKALTEDRPRVDLLLVIGTSLKVSPVSEILTHLRHSVPQILINKTPVRHINPDIVLLGNADEVVQYLAQKLGWDLPDVPPPANGAQLDAPRPNFRKRPSDALLREPRRVADSHVWLFEGAEGGRWVEELERKANGAHGGHEDGEDGADAGDADSDGDAYGDLLPRAVKKARTA
ncbi:SIR2-domain-containing protein [Phanerochaete sordida]|uniref:SIR2-domain-containing protein n=1 Tax=Phanerochaete sordida TaxID=48140 RepID=A0A9P3GCD5_9APHY|nr:SIR2-domain-containing protein [Phanerochaete sordida]